ncbi:bacillithiol system redox-active protein YtxJ [Halalkalibacter alkaliphilus]|uniref:Bacillithiol system redox-active protein YtxJ n=1 Tax=Halalkalibacter alkaliphilus TaxID=2917993 RepID=A0A9X2I702_9BACI|nr:bacillithiol system redox-active protein YtxJ [Halalkalibacter alkaliphilus]MCL7747445.1 bacillithiol system redox-active protein YtxJ [Halalkalibacter alkaliphilus]
MSIRELISIDDWKELNQSSGEKPVLLLKHSTTCPISAEAFKEFQAFQKGAENEFNYALVKVIEQRPVSNAIAEETGVKHESPQCFLIKEQEVTWVDSHWSITKRAIEKAINQ